MYSVLSRIYHHYVHTGWFFNHLTKASPCSFLWRHHLLTTRDQESCSRTTSPQDWRYPEFSTSLLAGAHTKPNHYQDWRGATPGCFFCEATSLLVLVPPHHAALPGRHAPPTRQVGLIACPPSCFEWCFSPSLFRCRDFKPWTGGVDLQAHHGRTGLPHLQAGGHQDLP